MMLSRLKSICVARSKRLNKPSPPIYPSPFKSRPTLRSRRLMMKSRRSDINKDLFESFDKYSYLTFLFLFIEKFCELLNSIDNVFCIDQHSYI